MGVYIRGGYLPGLSYDDGPFVFEASDDGDAAYDRMVARVDAGEECPACHQGDRITRGTALGIDLFECGCGCRWFDAVTRLTEEAP